MLLKTITVLLFAVLAHGDSHADMSAGKYSKYYPQSRYHSGYSYQTGNNRQKDDYYRYPLASDISPYTTRPIYSSRIQTAESNAGSDAYGHSTTGQESWSPSTSWNGTYVKYPTGYTRGSYQHDAEGSQSVYQYQYIRSPQTGYYKKPSSSSYYGKGKIVKVSEKPKQKKPQLMYYSSPVGYKKTMYPRVHTPYTMHKYPIKKNVHPYYRRFYQAAYAMPSPDMLRSKVKNIYSESFYGGESSTAATPTDTTDRMYNTGDRNDYPITSEDYVNYNDTYPSRSNTYTSSYDSYDEVDQTTAEPSSYDESSTRGYYGDRIYMSTQLPSQEAEKGMKHRLYVVRSEPEDDDDGTIFD